MRILTNALIAAGLVVAAPATAQAPAAQTVTPEEQATMDRAGLIFSLFGEALRDEGIAAEEKNALIGCLYGNTLESISEATGEALAENPQIDASDATNVYIVAAIVCGAREQGAPADAPAGEAPQAPTE